MCMCLVSSYQVLNVLPFSMQCCSSPCSSEVGMLPEASAEGNFPTSDEQIAYNN